ncbi:DNA cytosine methyltransferase [Bradyrhizobium japonicum]|uniref:DNA cytosine methyltransferase n=1 Tax=Bradyrhizobium japonicum TaxID=375 RepID=UPI00209FA3CE|nr:DNA cytosine methyltransferase [Bradyrhizobium japonicum]
MAGWPDDRPLWTGSCPCQPFSVAGKGRGADDPRHLWPHFRRLVSACRPPVLVGEQVAGKAGYGWLDGVRADLEREGYSSRGVDIPACAVDAPHQRSRLYWIAVVNPASLGRREGRSEHELRGGRSAAASADAPGVSLLAHPDSGRRGCHDARQHAEPSDAGSADGGHGTSRWAGSQLLVCHDGKTRRAQPGVPMLVDGLPGRVALWSIAGNAIVPVLAAEVLKAHLETEGA